MAQKKEEGGWGWGSVWEETNNSASILMDQLLMRQGKTIFKV
jgi:hypothetical protein